VENEDTVQANEQITKDPEEAEKKGTQSSMIVIFSVWKTMIGTAVVSLPWAFQQSGLMLGLLITFFSFMVSFYTCKLIVDASIHDKDYSLTLKKYYGQTGFYLGLLCPCALIVAAVVVFYVVMCQCMYPLILAIMTWCTGTEYEY